MGVDETGLHFAWIEPDRLAVSAFPGHEAAVRWLSAQGIGAIVTLTEQPLTSSIDPGLLQELDLPTYHEPIVRSGVPDDLDATYRVMDFVDEMLTERRPVLLHCYAGSGRVGLMLYAYYLQQNIALDEIQQHLRYVRPSSAWEALTPVQRHYIEVFDAHLHEA